MKCVQETLGPLRYFVLRVDTVEIFAEETVLGIGVSKSSDSIDAADDRLLGEFGSCARSTGGRVD